MKFIELRSLSTGLIHTVNVNQIVRLEPYARGTKVWMGCGHAIGVSASVESIVRNISCAASPSASYPANPS